MFTLVGAALFIFVAMAAINSKNQMVRRHSQPTIRVTAHGLASVVLHALGEDLHPRCLQYTLHFHFRNVPHGDTQQCRRLLLNGKHFLKS